MPGQKVLAKKKAQVTALAKELETAQSIVFSDYQGLTVAEDTEMRAAFRKEGLKYKVVKNNISLRALKQLGIEGVDELLQGPTALAYSSEDLVLAPRLVKKFADQFKKTEIKGGIVEKKLSELKTILALASIPSTEVLYGQLVCSLMFPIRNFAVTLNVLAQKAEEAGVATVGELAGGTAAKAEEQTESEAVKTEEAKTEEAAGETAEVEAEKAEESKPEAAEAAQADTPAIADEANAAAEAEAKE